MLQADKKLEQKPQNARWNKFIHFNNPKAFRRFLEIWNPLKMAEIDNIYFNYNWIELKIKKQKKSPEPEFNNFVLDFQQTMMVVHQKMMLMCNILISLGISIVVMPRECQLLLNDENSRLNVSEMTHINWSDLPPVIL